MKKDNNKIKKIGAWIAIIILLLACCMPMIFAFGNGEDSQVYFKASLAVAIMVPIMAYAIWMVYKLLNRNKKVVDSDMENIIFDVGQVLVKYDWETYLDSFGFPKEERDKIAEVVFQSNTWNERDRSSETEQYYVDQMVKAAPEYEKDIREVMRRSDKTIEKTDYAETWVRYLKDKGYHVYILSNYATDTLERTEDKLTFLKYVDGAVFSCQVKQIKPEPEIYKTLLGRYHLDPEKSVFLDDRAENCEAARKQGIHAIQFKSFKQAAAELEKLGVN
jgi:putative hydrolase of the HAD superfamily